MTPAVAFALVTLLMPHGSHQVARVPLPYTQQCDEDACEEADAKPACDVLGQHQKDLATLLGGEKVLGITCYVVDGTAPDRRA